MSVREEIECYGMTVKDLAAVLGLETNTIYKWKSIPKYALAFLEEYKDRIAAQQEAEDTKELAKQAGSAVTTINQVVGELNERMDQHSQSTGAEGPSPTDGRGEDVSGDVDG